MTSTLVVSVVVLLAVGVLLSVRRIRSGHSSRTLDVGAVSTRWLAELKRDEPWTRS